MLKIMLLSLQLSVPIVKYLERLNSKNSFCR